MGEIRAGADVGAAIANFLSIEGNSKGFVPLRAWDATETHSRAPVLGAAMGYDPIDRELLIIGGLVMLDSSVRRLKRPVADRLISGWGPIALRLKEKCYKPL